MVKMAETNKQNDETEKKDAPKEAKAEPEKEQELVIYLRIYLFWFTQI